LAGCWKPPWSLDELLPDPFDEPLSPLDELDDEPEPDDEPDVDEVPPVLGLPELAAAWVDPGSITATTPAATTLATDTVAVVAFSRRRPCSRSATACAICRALLTCPADRPRASRSSQLLTFDSVTRPAAGAVDEPSQNVLSKTVAAWQRGFARPPGTASI